MKKIILNGCSWVAGDEIVWDKFCNERNLKNMPYLDKSQETHSLRNEYRISYRNKFNQGAILSNLLKTEVVDLSKDGASNDSISLTTINYILSIPEDERQNFHVIVGWTIITRLVLYLLNQGWGNIHLSDLDNLDSKNKSRIQNLLISNEPPDWYLNYFKNVFLLENFLKKNNVSYTFYRSIGSKGEFFNEQTNQFMVDLKNAIQFEIQNLSPEIIDNSNWLTFYEEDKNLGFVSNSWTSYCQEYFKYTWYISETNKHPNIKCTTQLCEIIKNYLLKNNLLS